MDFLFLGLLIAAIPFVLPIASWVSVRRTRTRVEALESALEAQEATIDRLKSQVAQLRRQVVVAPLDTAPAPAASTEPAPPPGVVRKVVVPVLPPVVPRAPEAPPVGTGMPPRPDAPVTPGRPAIPGTPGMPSAPGKPDAPRIPGTPRAPRIPDTPGTPSAPGGLRTLTPSPPSTPPTRDSGFDWESLVGVKLFSAIAGIALVVAAVFFLKYSVEHGWLQPPVRVVIGIVVAIALLVACEMKAARRYPFTANALDAAAIAILFSTFFAAHALWNLIPALVAFGLLGVVTAVAVLLSIRRESLFIAVLGLLGGFATPALLSSGENRPVGLFAYLMLLNVGLAWVAYRQTWPLLTGLTLVLTTVYQWVWVFKFLDQSPLPLAMGIFLVFPLATFAGLTLARRGPSVTGADVVFLRTAVIAAALPLLFALYLSAVPAYGDRPWLLFGFLLLVDAGLFAVAIARQQGLLHAAGALATLSVMVIWLSSSYSATAAYPTLVCCAAFVVFFIAAPAVAERLGHPLPDEARNAEYASPLLLIVPAVLGRIEPAFASPLLLFGTLLALVLLVAWRAIAARRGPLYFVAAFFAVATEASWSSSHLTLERLRSAVVIYAVFGIASVAVPFVARRLGRALRPEGGAGLVLIASLGLLLFLSAGSIAPVTLWALALLLAIINAGLFIESAAGRLPLVSIAGSIASWLVLASWWLRAAGAVGVLASLSVLAGLTLLTYAGHAWIHRSTSSDGRTDPGSVFTEGHYLGLFGHLFLLFVATNRALSLPPWPWMATLAVLTLASSTVSLVTRAPALHAAGAIAAGVIIGFWACTAGDPWMLVALMASAVASAYALAWMVIAPSRPARIAAALLLVLGELTAIVAMIFGGAPFPVIVVTHVANLSILLWLAWTHGWRHVALWAVVLACLAALTEWQVGSLQTGWGRLLALSFAMYVVFIAYPLLAGRRASGARDPYVAAVLASAMFLFAGRAALLAGGFGWLVGALPVAEAAVLALLLRDLIRTQPAAERDPGRLAIVAGAALAFVTVAIPMQLNRQWITIGWALEGAALAWLYRRIPHRGLLAWSIGLLGAVFVRLALNPGLLLYEPRGAWRILNWYLYAYLTCAVAFLLAAWWLTKTDDRVVPGLPRASSLLSAGAVVLLFLLLNIEIADFYATGPAVMFRFGVTVSQDLTYTIGWLIFGMALLGVSIYLNNRPGRITALALVAVTTFKCFLYDLGSLGGLYRVGSLVGLAIALALISLALQKYVLARPEKPL